jgi:hypothetical protein
MRESLSDCRAPGAEPRRDRDAVSRDATSSIQGYPHRLLYLQRTLGNRSVAQLVQSKRLTTKTNIRDLQPNLVAGVAKDRDKPGAARGEPRMLSTPAAVAANSLPPAPSPEQDKSQTVQLKPPVIPLRSSKSSVVPKQAVASHKPSAPQAKQANKHRPAADGGSKDAAAEAGGETLRSPASREKAPDRPEEDPAYQAIVGQLETKAEYEKSPEKTPDKKQQETILASNLTPEESGKQDAYSNHLT